jgi:hypothetical protein
LNLLLLLGGPLFQLVPETYLSTASIDHSFVPNLALIREAFFGRPAGKGPSFDQYLRLETTSE